MPRWTHMNIGLVIGAHLFPQGSNIKRSGCSWICATWCMQGCATLKSMCRGVDVNVINNFMEYDKGFLHLLWQHVLQILLHWGCHTVGILIIYFRDDNSVSFLRDISPHPMEVVVSEKWWYLQVKSCLGSILDLWALPYPYMQVL
jgi:hypothetical protein